ncbi:hypothetical protein P7C71_g4480, partial [Lecanoromycetidae sp. Uapishka_2]
MDTGVSNEATPARNKPCPCGSKRKFKKCCGRDQVESGLATEIDVAANENASMNSNDKLYLQAGADYLPLEDDVPDYDDVMERQDIMEWPVRPPKKTRVVTFQFHTYEGSEWLLNHQNDNDNRSTLRPKSRDWYSHRSSQVPRDLTPFFVEDPLVRNPGLIAKATPAEIAALYKKVADYARMYGSRLGDNLTRDIHPNNVIMNFVDTGISDNFMRNMATNLINLVNTGVIGGTHLMEYGGPVLLKLEAGGKAWLVRGGDIAVMISILRVIYFDFGLADITWSENTLSRTAEACRKFTPTSAPSHSPSPYEEYRKFEPLDCHSHHELYDPPVFQDQHWEWSKLEQDIEPLSIEMEQGWHHNAAKNLPANEPIYIGAEAQGLIDINIAKIQAAIDFKQRLKAEQAIRRQEDDEYITQSNVRAFFNKPPTRPLDPLQTLKERQSDQQSSHVGQTSDKAIPIQSTPPASTSAPIKSNDSVSTKPAAPKTKGLFFNKGAEQRLAAMETLREQESDQQSNPVGNVSNNTAPTKSTPPVVTTVPTKSNDPLVTKPATPKEKRQLTPQEKRKKREELVTKAFALLRKPEAEAPPAQKAALIETLKKDSDWERGYRDDKWFEDVDSDWERGYRDEKWLEDGDRVPQFAAHSPFHHNQQEPPSPQTLPRSGMTESETLEVGGPYDDDVATSSSTEEDWPAEEEEEEAEDIALMEDWEASDFESAASNESSTPSTPDDVETVAQRRADRWKTDQEYIRNRDVTQEEYDAVFWKFIDKIQNARQQNEEPETTTDDESRTSEKRKSEEQGERGTPEKGSQRQKRGDKTPPADDHDRIHAPTPSTEAANLKSQMLQHLTQLVPSIPIFFTNYLTPSFSLTSNRDRIFNSPFHPANMSRIPQDYDGWLTKSKHDYYSTTVEAKEAPELIWNCALKPWMRDVERYEIGWGDREALQDALGEIYERYGPVELVTEFHDVRGRIWVGCYYGATEVRNEERKQIFLCTKIKVGESRRSE